MSATDVIYERLLEAFDAGALDDPVLERALREARPNRELEAAYNQLTGRLRASEEQAAAAEAHRRQDARNHADALQALRETHKRALRASQRQVRELEARPVAKPSVSFESGERERLDDLGWVKRAAG